MGLPKDSSWRSENSELIAKVQRTLDYSLQLFNRINKMVADQEMANEAAAQRKIEAYGAKLSAPNAQPVAKPKTKAELLEGFEAFKLNAGLDMNIYGAKAMAALEARIRRKAAYIENFIDVHQDLVANFEFEKNSGRLDKKEEGEMAKEIQSFEKNKLNPAKLEYHKLVKELIGRQEYTENLWEQQHLQKIMILKKKLKEQLKELEAVRNKHEACGQITKSILHQDP